MEEEAIERTVILKSIDERTCKDVFYGIFDRERGECRVKLREDPKNKQVILIKLRPEAREL